MGRDGPRGRFDQLFAALTGLEPPASSFPWQRSLFEGFCEGRIPALCDIPTGLGKTSVIAIWVLALALSARDGFPTRLPRRLVYVVNRRTVVDQATAEVEALRRRLQQRHELTDIAASLGSLAAIRTAEPIAISTLRGQFADNAEWRTDPARPAVIVGTVDMIGSRLLFAGYGCGFKSRPLHAGFLAEDALLVHDEAHLEPAFQSLIESIVAEQQRADVRPLRIMALTATARSGGQTFGLSEAEDLKDERLVHRLNAQKGLALFHLSDERELPKAMVERAMVHFDTGRAVLIYLRRLDHLEHVARSLRSKAGTDRVRTLTGTLRGRERDAFAREDPVFARFLSRPPVKPREGTVFLVCSSAGEVGIDMSADHLTCDLTPFDSMAQRFGRVNRFGGGDALIDVLEAPLNGPSARTRENGQELGSAARDPDDEDGSVHSESPLERFYEACARTAALLRQLPLRDDGRLDASPGALRALPSADRHAAFTPPPQILPTSEILFDAWSLTSVRSVIPGRPQVEPWLHGVAQWEPPETHVAWRQEVEVIGAEGRGQTSPQDLLDDYPLKPHELLRDRTDRVLAHVRKLADRHPNAVCWIVSDAEVDAPTLEQVVGPKDASKARRAAAEARLRGRTLLLAPPVGGLKDGLLDGDADFDEDQRYDVADEWNTPDGSRRRQRVWDSEPQPPGMRLVRVIDTKLGVDDEAAEDVSSAPRFWRWYVRPRSADDDGTHSALRPMLLDDHLEQAQVAAASLTSKLGLDGAQAMAVRFAAGGHDRGKHRAVWQRSIRNPEYPNVVLAKSGDRRALDIGGYRHEFGSLLDVARSPEFQSLSHDSQDLALHLIAAHHGRARPHFPSEEAFDQMPQVSRQPCSHAKFQSGSRG